MLSIQQRQQYKMQRTASELLQRVNYSSIRQSTISESQLLRIIDDLLARSSKAMYEAASIGELVYIISEKQLRTLREHLEENEQVLAHPLQTVPSAIVSDIENHGYTYYDYHLRVQASEDNQNPELKIKILTKRLYSQLLKISPKILRLERKIIKQKGQKIIELHPFRIDVEIITMKQIQSILKSSDDSQKKFEDLLKLRRLKVNFYHNETIQKLLQRIRSIMSEQNTQFRVYAYDASLFVKSNSFVRMIECHLKKQFSKNPYNQDQLRFYQLQEESSGLRDSPILEFFPGKLLKGQSVDEIKGNRVQKLILEIKDNDWIFPEQPAFSVAKMCRFCMMKSQLYIDFSCKMCEEIYLFCSKICHYQFLYEHPCEQAREAIIEQYGQEYLQQQMGENQKAQLGNSSLVISKRETIQYIKAETSNLSVFKNSKITNYFGAYGDSSLGGGMSNLGNTCYMNASLQALIRTSLTKMLFDMKRDIESSQHCKVTKAYLNLIRARQSLPENESLSKQQMLIFKDIIDKNLRQFQGYLQHDAHQFIVFFLDTLSEELRTITNSPNRKQQNLPPIGKSDKDEQIAKRQWLNLICSNSSPIIKLFYGQTKTQIDCPYCHTSNKKFDCSSILSVSIPDSNPIFEIEFFYEFYQFKNKIVYGKIKLQGETLEDLTKSILTYPKLSEGSLETTKAFLIGFKDPCQEIKRNKKLSQIVTMIFPKGSTENQLFFFQMPQITCSYLIFKFTKKSKVFTFKRPLFFTEPLEKLRNFKIFQAVTDYILGLAKLYLPYKPQDLRSDMVKNPQAYFRLKLIRKQQNDFRQQIQLKPNTQHSPQIQSECQIEVCIQQFDKISEMYAKLFKTVSENFNLYVKLIQIPKKQTGTKNIQKPQILQDCLKEEFNRRQLLANGNEWFCSTCNTKRRVHQITKLYKTNKYLFIHIKRFKQGADGKLHKNSNNVILPLQLDLRNIVCSPTLPESYYKTMTDEELKAFHLSKEINLSECYKYNLVGAILHNGMLGGGHYTTMLKTDGWYEYNDAVVSKINIEKLLKEPKIMGRIYILLYERSQ